MTTYDIHSMLHKAKVRIPDEEVLKTISDYEQSNSRYILEPDVGRNKIKIVVLGSDSDSVMIYGSQSTEQANKSIKELEKRILQENAEMELIKKPDIVNLAISGSLETELNLESLIEKCRESDIECEYEPEQFPGALLYLTEPDCTITLFATGGFGIQGLDEKKDIGKAIEKVKYLISGNE